MSKKIMRIAQDGMLYVNRLNEGDSFSISPNFVEIGGELIEGYPFVKPVIDDSLVLWLDGTTGNNYEQTGIWKDLSGNGNNGQLMNFDFTEDSGWVDGGLKFDGVDDWVVTTKGIQFNQPFTFCLDGDFSKLTYENWGIARKEVYPPYEFSFYQRDSSSFRFVIWQSGGASVVNFVIPAEIVHNSSSLIFVNHMDSIVLFANGVNVQEVNINTSLWDNHIATDRPLEFGVGGYAGVQKYGDLILYGVKFYNRALTDEEILQNYQAGQCSPLLAMRGDVIG